MRKYFITLFCLLFLSVFILQGCTTLPDRPFLKKDASEVTPLKMDLEKTPKFRSYSTGGLVAAIVVSGVLFGVIGGAIGYGLHYASTKESPNPDIPDFGKMVYAEFKNRAKKEIPSWPDKVFDLQEDSDQKTLDKKTNLLIIKVNDIRLEVNSGLAIETIITLKDMQENIIWEKGFLYDSALFGRPTNEKALKADQCKLLKEEYAFAAEKTVTDFINHFKNSQQNSKISN